MMRSLSCLLVIAFLSGCSGLETEYGRFRGGSSETSINGLGVLRRSFENADWRATKVSRLNERVESLDTIVWAPTEPNTLYDDAREWFENWLSQSGHTLVYIVPDQGADLAYFQQARTTASPAQQLAYRRRIAQLQTQQMLTHIQNANTLQSGWFVLSPLPRGSELGKQGNQQWPIESVQPSAAADTKYTLAGVTYQVEPLPTNTSTSTSGTSSTNQQPQPTGVMNWSTSTSEATDLTLTPLLVSKQGATLIAKMTSSDWPDSQIIVVSGGSLVCNYSLTKPLNQKLLAHLIAECGDKPSRFGYLSTGFAGANVSPIEQEISRALGLEALTTWPMNVIMLNLVLIGFIACMILVPIFGRPQRTLTKSNHDFADHLDAVATLMYKSKGDEEARRRISDYMRRIRGENTGPWLLPEVVDASSSNAIAKAKTFLKDLQSRPENIPSENAHTMTSPIAEQAHPGLPSASDQAIALDDLEIVEDLQPVNEQESVNVTHNEREPNSLIDPSTVKPEDTTAKSNDPDPTMKEST